MSCRRQLCDEPRRSGSACAAHCRHGRAQRGFGRIVHFGFSHAAEARAWPTRAVYDAAKVGLVSFTKTLPEEEAPHGITVNMVAPGDIRGAFKEMTISDAPGVRDKETPVGRPGTGEDIARVIIEFLCQPGPAAAKKKRAVVSFGAHAPKLLRLLPLR